MNFKEVAAHDDLVHDIAFDYYGKRFASCSSDRIIKVWSMDEEEEGGSWQSVDIARYSHQDSIWRLSWANPEFGQILAACSEDGLIRGYEEQESINNSDKQKWTNVFTIKPNGRAITDVKFSHRNLGLIMGSVSADGYLRIHDCPDIFNLSNWNLLVI
jgi:WD40 repeat protein